MENTKLNAQGITRVKCFAVLLVVLIHTVAIPVNTWGLENSAAYIWSYSIGMLGVPLFLMSTGALLLQEKYGNWQAPGEIKKRALRILVPLLVYGWVYAMMEIFFEQKTITLMMPFEALRRVITGESWGHLWYMYMLLGLYLLLPVIRHLHWGTNEEQKRGMIAVMVFFGMIMPVIARAFNTVYIGSNLLSLSLPATLCHMLTFWTGALITQTNWVERWKKHFDAAGIISLLVLSVWPVLFQNTVIKRAILGYDSIFVWLSAAWVFSKLYSCKVYHKSFTGFEKLSFGIYLIHPFFMNLLYKAVNISPLMGNAVLTIPLFTILLTVLALVSVWIISKIPIAKKWLI